MQLRPSAAQSLVLLSMAALFAWLGQWQLERKQHKEQMLELYANAPELDYAQADELNLPYARATLNGQYDRNWHLLVDNKVFKGRAGVHTLTLFHPTFSKPVLVNRGWLPWGPDRGVLPVVPTPENRIQISGMFVNPSEDGVRIGKPEKLSGLAMPALVTYLSMSEVDSALDGNVSQLLLQLDAKDASGFQDREWKPTVMMPAQHGAYALQWFSLSLAIAIIWFTLSWRRGRQSRPGEDNGATDV
jgi:surfeit locus 1 family protein